MSTSIASAVVLPDLEEASLPSASQPTSNKRRQSATEEDSAKRPRIEGDGKVPASDISATENGAAVAGVNAMAPQNAATVHGDAPATQNTASVQDNAPVTQNNATATGVPNSRPKPRERGRELRLFGAALAALSNKTTTAIGRERRLEIEQRQQALKKVRDEENEQVKAENAARRRAQRWEEQKRFEKQSMKMRHANLLHCARFLHTEAEPKMYYKARDMTTEEHDRLHAQHAEAEKTIRSEEEEFELREKQKQEHRYEGHDSTKTEPEHAMDALDMKDHGREYDSTLISNVDGINSPKDQDRKDSETRGVTEPESLQGTWPPHSEFAAEDTNQDDDDDNNGEEVVEATEDTVIY